jgi:MFS transporter, DHA1 family, tetracycline resistance protein
MRKPSVLVIFLTVFIDLVGFGIVVPLVPLYSKHFGAHGLEIGLIIASFSAMQFVFSPIWGRLSDRHGRRPILLLSTAGAALSYMLFALSSGLDNHKAAIWLMVLSRAFAGLCGGNITVAQAYIADITPPDKRSRRMGLIGMAFGLGFILGPAIGGISWAGFTLGGMSLAGLHIPQLAFHGFGPTGPGWVAAALCASNFLLAWRVLVESKQLGSEEATPRPHLQQWMHTVSQPKVGMLVIVFFLATFCFSCFESTLPLVVSDNFHLSIEGDRLSARTVTKLFVFCGVIGAFVQGFGIGRLVNRFGEPKIIAISLILTAASMAWLPFIHGHADFSTRVLFHPEGRPWLAMLGALALLSIGTGLTRPPLFGLLSNLTSAQEQGANIGVAQGAGSLARILGPIFATGLLPYVQALPYLICAGILLVTTALVAQRFRGESHALAAANAAQAVK